MDNLKAVIAIADHLQNKYAGDFTVADAFKIAAQIHLAECLTSGLQSPAKNYPTYLEAIAMALGYGDGKIPIHASLADIAAGG